jgi:prepilin-type processing-associated H-X9-DG protein
VLNATQGPGGVVVAGSASCFDLKRHQKKINVAFCDGHVETRDITTGDLQKIFLVPP